MRMAASVGKACCPFTTTQWKPPMNHMVRMMALSRKSTTLQQNVGVKGGQAVGPGPAHPVRHPPITRGQPQGDRPWGPSADLAYSSRANWYLEQLLLKRP